MLKIGLQAYKAVYFLRRHLNYFAGLLLITQGWGRKASSMGPDVSCVLGREESGYSGLVGGFAQCRKKVLVS